MSAFTSIRKMSVMAILVSALVILPLGKAAYAPPPDAASPAEIRTLVDRASHFLKEGRFQDALIIVDSVLESDEDNVAAHQIRAEISALWLMKYHKEILEESKKSLTDAQIPEIVTFMEQMEAGKADEVIETIRAAIRKDPEDASGRRSLYHYVLSRAYAKQGKVGLAINELRDAVGWNHDFEQAYYDLANAHLQLGNSDLATRLSDILLTMTRNRSNLEWHLLRATMAARTARTSFAKVRAAQVINRLGDKEKGRILGMAYSVLAAANYADYQRLPEKEELTELLKDAREALDAARKEPDTQKKIDALEDVFSKARLFVVNTEIIEEPASAIVKARDEENAAEKAKLAGDAVEPLDKLLADILAQKEKALEDFKECAEKAVKADGLQAEPHILLAGYYSRRNQEGDLEKAAGYYEKYIERREQAQNHRYILGLVRLLQGRTDVAGKIFSGIKDDKGEKHELAYVGEALLAGLQGNAGVARQACEALVALRGKNDRADWPMLELMLAHICCAQEKPADAKPHIETGAPALGGLIITDDTDYAALLGTTDPKAVGTLNFAIALSNAGLTEQALEQCARFLKAAPDSVAGRFFEFMLLLSRREHLKEVKGKIEGLKKAFAARDPKNVSPCFAVAAYYNAMAANDPSPDGRDRWESDAMAEYELAMKTNPELGEVYATLAGVYARRGMIHEAEKIVKQGLEKVVGDKALLNMRIELMRVTGNPVSKEYIDVYNAFNEKVAVKGVEELAGVLALANYYRQTGRLDEARSHYEEITEEIEAIEDTRERQKQRKQYMGTYLALREMSLAQSKVEKAREYNRKMHEINKDYPGTDHFEGLCLLIEGKDKEAKAAFEAEIALGRLSMRNAMSHGGLALIALKNASSPEAFGEVHTELETARNLIDRVRDRESIFGNPTASIEMARGYLSFTKICTFMAQGGGSQLRFAAKSLNRTPILFPGAEGLRTTETSAFKGMNLLSVIKRWKTGNNFYDLAAGAYNLSQGLYAEASKLLAKEGQTNPGNFIALYFRARAEMALGHESSAIGLLKECQKKEEGKFSPAFSLLMGIYLKRDVKPHEEIVELFEKMCKLDPRFRHSYALYLEQRPEEDENKYKLALEQYDKLCKQEDLPASNRWNALNSAAWLRAEHFDESDKELKKAEQDVLDAITILEDEGPSKPYMQTIQGRRFMPTLATVKDTHGWVLYKQGKLGNDNAKYEKAAEVFDECIKLLVVDSTNRSIPVVLYHQGVVCDALRQACAETDKKKADEYGKKAVAVLKQAVRYQRFEERTKARELLDKLEALGNETP